VGGTVKQIPAWRLKTGTEESRKLSKEFCLDADDVARMFGVSRSLIYVWTRTGRYGFPLHCRRSEHSKRSSIAFRLSSVQSFAWHQGLTLDFSVLHPTLLAAWKLEIDPDTGAIVDLSAKVAE
jgi:hypothetical protein